jgi:hypothetical protein
MSPAKRPYNIEPAVMSRLEAERIAFDPPYTWPSETLDKAAKVLEPFAKEGRDRAAFVQLCYMKAALQRIKRAIVRASKENEPALLLVAAGLCEVPEL